MEKKIIHNTVSAVKKDTSNIIPTDTWLNGNPSKSNKSSLYVNNVTKNRLASNRTILQDSVFASGSRILIQNTKGTIASVPLSSIFALGTSLSLGIYPPDLPII